MSNLHIKKDDMVLIKSGEDKGKKGKVLKVLSDGKKIVVDGVAIVSKHTKPRKQTDVGGIIKTEAPIYASKAMYICPKCGKPTRVGSMTLDNGEKVRVCKSCNESLNN